MCASCHSPTKTLKVKVCACSSICRSEVRWHEHEGGSGSAWKSCRKWKWENLGQHQRQLPDFRGTSKVLMLKWCKSFYACISVWRGGGAAGYSLLAPPIWGVMVLAPTSWHHLLHLDSPTFNPPQVLPAALLMAHFIAAVYTFDSSDTLLHTHTHTHPHAYTFACSQLIPILAQISWIFRGNVCKYHHFFIKCLILEWKRLWALKTHISIFKLSWSAAPKVNQ